MGRLFEAAATESKITGEESRDTMKTNSGARTRFAFVIVLMLGLDVVVSEAATAQRAQQSDMIGRIFSNEFSARLPAAPNWFDGGESYVVIDRADDGKGSNVVLYDTATGQKRETLITAAQLVPAGANAPLSIEALSWAPDKSRVLI